MKVTETFLLWFDEAGKWFDAYRFEDNSLWVKLADDQLYSLPEHSLTAAKIDSKNRIDKIKM